MARCVRMPLLESQVTVRLTHAGGSAGVLPRTRRRSVHGSRNPSRAPAASLRDRLRHPLTEPACRMVRQLSGSGRGLRQDGRGQMAGNRPGDGGEGQGVTLSSAGRLRSLGTGPAADSSSHQRRPATADDSRTVRANWEYVRPETQTVEDERRGDCCQHCCQAAGQDASHADSRGMSAQHRDRSRRSWTMCLLLRI
jgi:hypothetical protein